jgi:flagellin-like protein
MIHENGVSEIIGTILLISIVMIGAMIVAVNVLSQPAPQEIPQVQAIVGNDSGHIFIRHNGGDALTPAATIIRIDGSIQPVGSSQITLQRENITIESPWSSTPWSIGTTLKITDPLPPPKSVVVVYNQGSSPVLVVSASFI